MLPLRDDVPGRRAPLVVVTLLVANAVVFAFMLGLDPEAAARAFEAWGLVPRAFLRALAGEPQRAWLTPLSAMFLHGDVLHLAGNGLYLWIFGRPVEDLLGRPRFALFYAVCGLVAALVHVASAPRSFVPAIGASGAVSGLLGAYAVSYPLGRLRLLWPPLRVPAIAFLLAWIALQLASGLSTWGRASGGVAWWAHIGGFVAGAALARAMWVRPPTRSRLRI